MELINIDDLTSGYRDRMRRVALMDPLDELEGKKQHDEAGKKIDMRGLGMLTLLFFFERQLTREYKTSRQEVSEFLLHITRDTYKITPVKMEEITEIIISVFRPQDGRKRKYRFYNWETKEYEEIEYNMLKADRFNDKTDRQYYALADDGLELLFATKEFYSEFQISINQLLLKQQISKGQFHDAYRQVREMELNVITLIERSEKMRLEIVRSIVSSQTFERYQQLIEEAYDRFDREDKEFVTLKEFVKQTRDTMYRDNLQEKELESYELIHKIANELDVVHYEHTRLIELTTQLRNTAIATAQESLYYTGVPSFNFEKDIVTTILAKALSPDLMKGVMQPFMKIEQNPQWSLLSVLDGQNIIEERGEEEASAFPEAVDELAKEEYRKWLGEKYRQLIKRFVSDYEQAKINTLEDWMDLLQETDPDILSKRYFYSFWLLMHQVSPLQDKAIAGHESETLLQFVVSELDSKQLKVTELPDSLHYVDKYSIQNMAISVTD